MILNAIASRLKRQARGDFKGRHYEAALIVQAVSWYLRHPLSYRDIEELILERGLEVDHSTINRWVLAYAPLIERRLRAFRKPHCGSVRIDETDIKIRGQWRYLYRAIDKPGIVHQHVEGTAELLLQCTAGDFVGGVVRHVRRSCRRSATRLTDLKCHLLGVGSGSV
jgi:hypothetical protein